MDSKVFINAALDESFKRYIANKDLSNSLEYNSFMVVVIRLLILIYGEEIVNYYNNKDENSFNSLMIKYGYTVEEYSKFVNSYNRCYNFTLKQESKAIKKKNKYFNLVQKYLIDMLVTKNTKEPVSNEVKNEFYELLFTANTKDFYRRSIALVEAYNPYEIDDYFKKQNLI